MVGSRKARGFEAALVALAALAAVAAPVALARSARAETTFAVTKTADTRDGACSARDCSLREAIIAANAAPGTDTVTVPPGIYVLKRAPTGEDAAVGGDLDVTEDLTIVGAGARRTVIDAAGILAGDRALDVIGAGTSLSLARVTVKGGRPDGQGGGIRSAGPLTISDSTVRGNRADSGGGIHSAVRLTLERSTVSRNETACDGAGVRAVGTATITNSTISGNEITLACNGSAIALGSATTLTAINATIANNSSADPERGAVSGGTAAKFENSLLANAPTANCFFLPEQSAGHNLSGDDSCNGFDQASDQTATDPKLGPLRDNGGPTNTHALLGGSPAINAGGPSFPATDQRGVDRPQGAASDIGAFEKEPRRR